MQAGGSGAVKAQSDVRVFVARAAGYRGAGRSVRWNDEKKGFEDVPWELRETIADSPPEGGFRFEEEDSRGRRRLEEKNWLVQHGFRVLENYPAREDMPADKWLCTLRGEKTVAPDGKLTVRFWEHPGDEDGFYAEVDGAEDSKEGRLLRDVLRIGSGSTREEGGYLVEEIADSNRPGDGTPMDWSGS